MHDFKILNSELCLLIQFHSQQLDKHRKAAKDAQERQEFLKLQMSELAARKDTCILEERDYNEKNMELLKVGPLIIVLCVELY